jgi:hypothetical protein
VLEHVQTEHPDEYPLLLEAMQRMGLVAAVV